MHCWKFGRPTLTESMRIPRTPSKPGSVGGPAGLTQAPHLAVSLMMRGLLRRLTTRIYFPDEPLNERDEILQLVEPARRKTLLLIPEPGRVGHFRWDVHMQGEAETVFFEF